MSKNMLAIDISNSSVRFSVWKGGMVTQNVEFEFPTAQAFKHKEKLKEFVLQEGIKEWDLDDVVLSYSNEKTTLIPMSIFNESSKEAIYKLSFGDAQAGVELDYNRLPHQSLVNIFAMPDWVKSFFVMNFPRIIMQHEGSHLIRYLFAGSAYKPKAVLSIHKEHFALLVAHQNELKYYNYFNYSNAEDVLYYIGFALQQLQLDIADVETIVNTASGCELDIEAFTQWYQKLYHPKTPVQNVLHYLTKAIELCV